MAIVKMKRLALAAVKSQRDEILEQLMLMGCIEISQPREPGEDDELAGLLKREPAGYSQRKSEHDTVLTALELLDRYAPQKKPLLYSRPQVDQSVILDEANLQEVLEIAKRLEDTDNRIRAAEARISHIKGELESLEPWKSMDIPLDTKETPKCFVELGTIPAFVKVGDVEKALEDADCACRLEKVSEDEDAVYMLLICLKEDREKAAEALRAFSWSKPSVGEYQGTAAENISSMKSKLSELEGRKEELIGEIRKEGPRRNDLMLCADRLLTISEQAGHAERLLYTESAFTFEGWFPAEKEEQLTGLLSRYACGWEIRDPTEEETPDVPISLKNGKITSQMNMVTEMYSLPAYNGLDPNPWLLPTFALFFGIMFADMGYGLILILAGALIKFKVRARATVGYMGGLAMICGVSSFIFGAITGGFFGDAIPQIAALFGGSAKMPSLLDPLKDPMPVLIGCLAIGVVHMFIGVGLNGYLLIRDGKTVDAILSCGSVYVIFIGIALGALGVTWIVAIIGVVLVIINEGKESPSIGGKIGSGLYGLYNFVSGWFGDVLSYCRLMALMLAGAVIAQVFNSLGVMTGSIFGFILIFIVGHVLNFGLNVIGTYVHTSRLEYLEFFNKWYREGGRKFEPMTIKTDYYDIYKN